MGKQLDPGTEVPAVFCKSHTNGPDQQHVSAGTAMPSPTAVPEAWLRKNCSFPHTSWGPAYPPCPHSLSQQTFLSGWQYRPLWKVLASSSYRQALERQLKNSDTRWSFQFTVPVFSDAWEETKSMPRWLIDFSALLHFAVTQARWYNKE